MTEETLWLPQTVPVFPLPEAVLLPGQVLALHVFEPRYRAMVADALTATQHIAIALLKPDYEPLYLTSFAPIHDVVGVGRMLACRRTADGCFDIQLAGAFRAEIRREVQGKPYRVAQIDVRQYRGRPDPELRRSAAEELRFAIRSCRKLSTRARQQLEAVLGRCDCVGQAADLISVAIGAPTECRQHLLEECNPFRRAGLVAGWLREAAGGGPRYPVAAEARERHAGSSAGMN